MNFTVKYDVVAVGAGVAGIAAALAAARRTQRCIPPERLPHDVNDF